MLHNVNHTKINILHEMLCIKMHALNCSVKAMGGENDDIGFLTKYFCFASNKIRNNQNSD